MGGGGKGEMDIYGMEWMRWMRWELPMTENANGHCTMETKSHSRSFSFPAV